MEKRATFRGGEGRMAILIEKIKIISWLDLKASTLKLSNRNAAFGTITNKQTNKKTASTLKNKSDSLTTTVRACVILGKNE